MKKLGTILGILLAFTLLFTGCEKEEGEIAVVQSVADLTGYGPVGLAERFAGIIVNRGETKIEADSEKTIKEILVKEGDEVSEGDVLFTYDMELAELNLEKAELELQQMQSTVDAKTKEKAELEKEKEKARQEDQLSYTLEIQSCETEIREANYNISLKEKEVEKLREALEVVDFTAPVSGRVGKINENGGADPYTGEATALMTIVEAGTYRVKGYVNENNIGALSEGTPIIVRSRIDEQCWTGFVSLIDWENPVKENNNGGIYYEETASDEDLSVASKYPFYIELDDAEGLLLGQHVYIEPDLGLGSEAKDGIPLPIWYLIEYSGDTGSVFADNGKGKLEKRTLKLSADEEAGVAYVTEGLDYTDLIAMPDETLTEGMPCQTMSVDFNDLLIEEDLLPIEEYEEEIPATVEE